jgi:hypothetical protein
MGLKIALVPGDGIGLEFVSDGMRSQIVTSSSQKWGGPRNRPIKGMQICWKKGILVPQLTSQSKNQEGKDAGIQDRHIIICRTRQTDGGQARGSGI